MVVLKSTIKIDFSQLFPDVKLPVPNRNIVLIGKLHPIPTTPVFKVIHSFLYDLTLIIFFYWSTSAYIVSSINAINMLLQFFLARPLMKILNKWEIRLWETHPCLAFTTLSAILPSNNSLPIQPLLLWTQLMWHPISLLMVMNEGYCISYFQKENRYFIK